MDQNTWFLKPNIFERWMNTSVGWLARLGIGPRYIRLLEVTGRKTGKVYATPVNLLEYQGRRYLVGGRGHTNWSRNAAAAGEVTLSRGRTSRRYRVVPVTGQLKLEVLKAYLDEYRKTVQRFIEVPAGSPAAAFRAVADRHPVFEVID